MQVAALLDNSLDYEEWLAVNTAVCIRQSCRLTVVDCDRQQQKSGGGWGDLRCQGCGGLDNQPERPLLQLVRPAHVDSAPLIFDEQEELEELDSVRIGEQAPGFEFNLDCLNNVGNAGDDLDLDSLNALVGDNGELARELQLLFMGEDEEVETRAEITALFKENKTRHEKSKLYSVYQGKCRRCGGYMDNTRENQFREKWDDDVYRCLACGWRTSPAYAWNRNNPHLSGWRG